MPSLEIGCGRDPDPRCNVRIDLNEGIEDALQIDAVGPLPWDKDYFDLIVARDLLEHLSYYDTETALTEWVRVLKPGGILEVQVPDVGTCIEWYVNAPWRLIERIPEQLQKNPMVGFAWRVMGGQHDGDIIKAGEDWRLNAHMNCFDEQSLRSALTSRGLSVEQIQRNGHPNLYAFARKL